MAWPSTPIHGKCAKIVQGTTNIDYSSRWSINWVKDAAVFGRQGQEYKEAAPGQCSWTGTGEFLFVNYAAAQADLIALAIGTSTTPAVSTAVSSTVIKFCFDTTENYLVGDIIVTGFTIDAPVGDFVKGNFTFQGSGPLKFSA